jgi:molybdopterin/thiamine biosynthesis adenylyltransferase/rhodanese-related sulfurtransferase
MTISSSRYSRQQHVRYFGLESQARLQEACVLIVGVGGLGSPVSLYLAGAGVGKLILVDDDQVSVSNLHRQILFQEGDIEQSKVAAAATRLRALNSEIEIETINQAVNPENAQSLVDQATVVVDAADNFLASYLLSDLCLASKTPLVTASVLTTHGYLGVFCGTDKRPAPSLRAVFSSPATNAANCNTAGVTGPSVGVIGSYQAQETLKVILDDDSQLLGKLMYLDLWDYSQNIIDFSTAPEPDVYAPIIAISQINSHDLIVDVRSEFEALQAPLNLPSINIPNSDLQERIGEINNDRRVVCICSSGHRALGAAKVLLSHEFGDVCVTSRTR